MKEPNWQYVLVFRCGKIVKVMRPCNPHRQIVTHTERRNELKTEAFNMQSDQALRAYAKDVADRIGLPASLRMEPMYVKAEVAAFGDRIWRQLLLYPIVPMLPIFPSSTGRLGKAKFFCCMFFARLAGVARWLQAGGSEDLQTSKHQI